MKIGLEIYDKHGNPILKYNEYNKYFRGTISLVSPYAIAQETSDEGKAIIQGENTITVDAPEYEQGCSLIPVGATYREYGCAIDFIHFNINSIGNSTLGYRDLYFSYIGYNPSFVYGGKITEDYYNLYKNLLNKYRPESIGYVEASTPKELAALGFPSFDYLTLNHWSPSAGKLSYNYGGKLDKYIIERYVSSDYTSGGNHIFVYGFVSMDFIIMGGGAQYV